MKRILYVGGEKKDLDLLRIKDINVDYVQNGMIAINAAQTKEFDVIIIEDQLPLMTPSRLIEEFISMKSNIPILSILRSDERRAQILDDCGHGLFGWIEPESITDEEINELLTNAKNYHEFLKDVPRHIKPSFTTIGYSNIVGVSSIILDMYHLLIQIKNKDVTTLLTGESGTGKNLVANTLHKTSLRRDRPNIAVNCPAIPSELLESELFGHEKGAFTGAIERKDGKFLAANAGTIFLDEIGDMSSSLQAKILRVLESGEIERVGGAETIKVDVRIVSATNQNLEEKIHNGEFRQDLFHRINVFPIVIPPLREHKEDIPILAFSILKKLVKKHNTPVRYISYDGMNLLKAYSWPGNVRELENTLERIVLINDVPILTESEIKTILDESSELVNQSESIQPSPIIKNVPTSNDLKNTSDKIEHSELIDAGIKEQSGSDIVKTLKELEYEAIQSGLSRTNWNMTLTAKQLGISRMTLYRKLDQHGLRKNDE